MEGLLEDGDGFSGERDGCNGDRSSGGWWREDGGGADAELIDALQPPPPPPLIPVRSFFSEIK